MPASALRSSGKPPTAWAPLPVPLDAAVAVWSEPPIAMIGMDAGTFAAYARPFQRIDFFEIDPAVVALSDNADGAKEPTFHFLADAAARRRRPCLPRRCAASPEGTWT